MRAFILPLGLCSLILAALILGGSLHAEGLLDMPHGWQDTDGQGVPDAAELAGGTDPTSGSDDLYSPPIIKSPLVGENSFDLGVNKPSFSWETGQNKLFKLQFSHRHDFKKGTVTAHPRKVWLKGERDSQETFTPRKKVWKKITKKGDKIYWRVVGTNKKGGKRLFSMYGSLRITNPALSLLPDRQSFTPGEGLPDFTWDNNGNQRFALFFTADPGGRRDLIRYPEKGWLKAGPVRLPAKTVKKIRARGDEIYWWVQGTRSGGFTRSTLAHFTLESLPEVVFPVGEVVEDRPQLTVDSHGYDGIKVEICRNSYCLGKSLSLKEPDQVLGNDLIRFRPSVRDWKEIKSWGPFFFIRAAGSSVNTKVIGKASKLYVRITE